LPKKEYGWDDGNVPIIGEHSLAKHRILRAYVQKYIEILTKNPRIDRFKLTLVDGFAGGGIYEVPGRTEPHLGSPAILIEAAAAARETINQDRRKPIHLALNYIFVDKSAENLRALDDTLRKYVYPSHPGVSPTILTGTFETGLEAIIKAIKAGRAAQRAIFLLDQYGYTAVPLNSLQRIFSELPRAEVFLTLAVGWIASYLRNAAEAREVVRRALRVRAEATEQEIEENLLNRDDANAKLRVVQKLLHDAFVHHSGARYATPFFILSRGSHRPYWFLHLANSDKANDVVKELHWDIQNHFSHYGDAGLTMLGFDPFREVESVQLSFGFDPTARERTEESLLRQLPARVSAGHAQGIPFEGLFGALTNETPATRNMLRGAVTKLCNEGLLQKEGAEGERRRSSTTVRDSDLISIPRQGRLRL
jgi:three-Cys-motif partner protein